MSYTVYGLFFIPEEQMIYIGITNRSPYVAYHEYTCNNSEIKAIVQKYGYDSIRVDVLESNIIDINLANELKKDYIIQYGTDSLINIALGTNTMYGKSKESMQEHYKNTLGKWQQEHGNWLKGKKMPEEMVRQMSEQRKGKPLHENTLKRLREDPPTANPVYCVDTDVTYQSAAQAARVLGLDSSSILKCVKGKYTNTHGYHFGPPIPWSIKIEDNCPWDIKID